MDIDKALRFRDSQQWRSWLTENHNTRNEVWLVHYKKSSNRFGITLEDAVEEAICFGWIDSKLISIDGEKYILKYTPRKAGSVWSKINKERAEKLVESGNMTDAGLVKIDEAKKNGYWETAYTNKKKDVIPPDLKEALRKDKNAWINFQKFANSYRNMYIGWVTGAKTIKTRHIRITEVVKRAAGNKKPG